MFKTGMQYLKIQAEVGFVLRFRTFSFKNIWISYHQKNIEKSLCRLRVSSHRLEIEMGRWAKPNKKLNNRKCRSYDVLEDEFHFTMLAVPRP